MAKRLADDWREKLSRKALERGVRYMGAGQVTLLEEVPKGWEATVRGSTPYRVFVPDADHGSLDSATCTCPWFMQGHLCKHIAAACYAIEGSGSEATARAVSEANSDRVSTRGSVKPLADVVRDAPDQLIRDFLLEALNADDHLAFAFRARAGAVDAQAAIRSLKLGLQGVIRAHSHRGYIDYHAAWDFQNEYLDVAESTLRTADGSGDARLVFDLVNAVVEILSTVRVDDSNGFVSDAVMLCHEYWGRSLDAMDEEAAAQGIGELVTLATRLNAAKRGGDYDWFIADAIDRFLVEHFADDPHQAHEIIELADRRIDQIRRDLERRKKEEERRDSLHAYGYPARVSGARVFHDPDTPRWVTARLRAMRAQGDDLADIMACARPYAHESSVLLALATYLGEDGRKADMYALLEESIGCDNVSQTTRRNVMVRLRELYRVSGENDKLRDIIAKLIAESRGYERDPSPLTLLNEYRACYAADSWPTARNGLLERIESSEVRCDVLAAEGLSNRLLEELGTKYCQRDISSYEELLARDHSDVVIAWYRDRAENQMNIATGRRDYQKCVSMLSHLVELPGGSVAAQKVAANWRKRFPRRSALMDELERAGF